MVKENTGEGGSMMFCINIQFIHYFILFAFLFRYVFFGQFLTVLFFSASFHKSINQCSVLFCIPQRDVWDSPRLYYYVSVVTFCALFGLVLGVLLYRDPCFQWEIKTRLVGPKNKKNMSFVFLSHYSNGKNSTNLV